MTIIRRSLRPSHYTVIDNQVLQDKRLSWKAQGLLTYLLSLPDSWQINTKHLSKERSDGKDSTLSGLKELEALGYVKKICVRDDRGRILRWENQVFDLPQSGEGEEPETGEPESGFPDLENPESGFSRSGKPGDIYITNSNKDLINKKQRERSNAHEDSKISLSLASGSDLNPEDLDPPITPTLLIEKPETTAEGKTGSAAIVQTYNAPQTLAVQAFHPLSINTQLWMQAFNGNAPTIWPRLSIGFFMTQRTQDAIRGYMSGYASEEEALAYFIGALVYLRICEDPWWRSRKISGGTIFNPEKLPLAQFFQAAEDSKVNAPAVAASGLTDAQIKERSAMERVLKMKAEKLEQANKYRASIGAPLLESL